MKKAIFLTLMTFLSTVIYSQDISNSMIQPLNDINLVETEKLSEIETIIYSDLESINPNFLTQLRFEISVPEGEEDKYLSRIIELFTDFSVYDEIPYYSKRNETWVKLFREVERSNTFESYWSETLSLVMDPFNPGQMYFTLNNMGTGIIFTCTNLDPLYLGILRASKAEHMKISMSIEKSKGKLSFFGLGGAKAFRGFGSMRERLDTAFNGRIEAYFLWINDSLEDITQLK